MTKRTNDGFFREVFKMIPGPFWAVASAFILLDLAIGVTIVWGIIRVVSALT